MKKIHSKEVYDYIRNNSFNYYLDELLEVIKDKFNVEMNIRTLQRFLNRNNLKYKRLKRGVHLPIGTERIKHGYTIIKVSSDRWMYKGRYIYEQFHNVELKEDEYIIHLDNNRNNFDIDNLVLVKRDESGFIGSNNLYSKNPEITELGINIAKLNTKMKEVKK